MHVAEDFQLLRDAVGGARELAGAELGASFKRVGPADGDGSG